MQDPLFDTRPDEFQWEPWPGPADWTNQEWFAFCYLNVAKQFSEAFQTTFEAAREVVKKLADHYPVVASGRGYGKNYVSIHTVRREVPDMLPLPPVPPIKRNYGPRARQTFDRRGRRQY